MSSCRRRRLMGDLKLRSTAFWYFSECFFNWRLVPLRYQKDTWARDYSFMFWKLGVYRSSLHLICWYACVLHAGRCFVAPSRDPLVTCKQPPHSWRLKLYMQVLVFFFLSFYHWFVSLRHVVLICTHCSSAWCCHSVDATSTVVFKENKDGRFPVLRWTK